MRPARNRPRPDGGRRSRPHARSHGLHALVRHGQAARHVGHHQPSGPVRRATPIGRRCSTWTGTRRRDTRRRMLDMAAAERAQVSFYHAPFPATGHIAEIGQRVRVRAGAVEPALVSRLDIKTNLSGRGARFHGGAISGRRFGEEPGERALVAAATPPGTARSASRRDDAPWRRASASAKPSRVLTIPTTSSPARRPPSRHRPTHARNDIDAGGELGRHQRLADGERRLLVRKGRIDEERPLHAMPSPSRDQGWARWRTTARQERHRGAAFQDDRVRRQRQSERPEAAAALSARYGSVDPQEADVVVALGGDGLMLQTLHRSWARAKPIYGMNKGTVGFLMNEFRRGRPARSGSRRRTAASCIPC